MPLCNTEGKFTAKVIAASFIESRYNETGTEIAIAFVDAEGNEGKTYLDLSTDIITKGASAGQRHIDTSLKTLQFYGIDLPNQGANAINNLIHKEIQIFGKKNEKGYLNFYLNTGKPEVVIDPNLMNQRLSAMFGTPAQGTPAPTQAPAPQQQAAPAFSPQMPAQQQQQQGFSGFSQ